MDLNTAKDTLTDWWNNSFFWSDELGTDVAAANQEIISAAIGSVGTAADLDAFMAEVEGSITLYDPNEADFDNSGATVILDDGTEMSYQAYADAGLEGSEDPFAGMAPLFFDALAERKPVVGVDDMCKMDV